MIKIEECQGRIQTLNLTDASFVQYYITFQTTYIVSSTYYNLVIMMSFLVHVRQ